MNKQQLQQKVDYIANNIKWWYQPIKFCDGVLTHSREGKSDEEFYNHPDFGLKKWNGYIKPYLPFDIRDKVVLEIGSNSSLYLINAIKNGAEFAYGIELSVSEGGFYEQSDYVLSIFSEIYNFDYFSKIKVIKGNVLDLKWVDEITHKIDITFALNTLYWISCDENEREIENSKEKIKNLIDKIFSISKYFFILGDEGVEKKRKSEGLNFLCCGIETTLPFLIEQEVLFLKSYFPETFRSPSIILASSRLISVHVDIAILKKYFLNETIKMNQDVNTCFYIIYKEFCEILKNNKNTSDNVLFETQFFKYAYQKEYDKEYQDEERLAVCKNRVIFWKNLFLDIEKVGVNELIVLIYSKNEQNKYTVNIDGYHRLVCLDVLNQKNIIVKISSDDYKYVLNYIRETNVDVKESIINNEYIWTLE